MDAGLPLSFFFLQLGKEFPSGRNFGQEKKEWEGILGRNSGKELGRIFFCRDIDMLIYY